MSTAPASPAPADGEKPAMKKITHFFAIAIGAVAAFAVTPAGVALIHQYPKMAVLSGMLGALAALFHSPRES